VIVIVRHHFSDNERYAIAYYNDVNDGDKTKAQWNANPRLANRKELIEYIDSAMNNEGHHIGDSTPNFDEQGRAERRLFEADDDEDDDE
jgi:hypothetical protein